METVTSRDGTTIAHDREEDGPAVVLECSRELISSSRGRADMVFSGSQDQASMA
jgi:hypothetical protein